MPGMSGHFFAKKNARHVRAFFCQKKPDARAPGESRRSVKIASMF